MFLPDTRGEPKGLRGTPGKPRVDLARSVHFASSKADRAGAGEPQSAGDKEEILWGLSL